MNIEALSIARRLAGILAFTLFISGCGDGFSQKSLHVVVITGEYRPFVSSDTMSESPGVGGAYGIAADIVSTVLRDMNRKPSYEFRLWPVVESMLKGRKADIAFPFLKTPERLAYLCFSDPLFEVKPVLLFNRKAYQAAQPAANLGTLKLGKLEGYGYEPALLEYFPSIEPGIRSEQTAIEWLLDGRIQVLSSDKKASDHLLRTRFAYRRHELITLDRDDLSKDLNDLAEALGKGRELHLVVPRPRGSTEENCSTPFLQRFNEKLALIRDDDSEIHREIIARYETAESKREEVILRSTDRFPLIYAHKVAETDSAPPMTPANILIPDRTRAAIIHWAPAYQGAQARAVDASEPLTIRSLVRILEGPASGNLVWVSNVYISF